MLNHILLPAPQARNQTPSWLLNCSEKQISRLTEGRLDGSAAGAIP